MKLLLIDDEIVALNALKKRIDWVKYGFTEIFTAQDADEARLILEKENIDLMLCDVEMPGEDGLSLMKYTKEHFPDTDSIVVTCHADFNYIKQAMKFGARDYILKPIDYEELEAVLLQFKDVKDRLQRKEDIDKFIGKMQESKGVVIKQRNLEVSEERIKVVKEYIENHIQEKITVKDLANLVHINEQHLMRVFKKENGQLLKLE